MKKDKEKFEPLGEKWEGRSEKEGLRSVLDPNDIRGMKNKYIDTLHKAALSRFCPIAAGAKVLDFGCGVGRLTPFLARNNAKVTGIDITEGMIARARRLHPEAEFVCCDGKKFPFEEGFFDAAFSVFVVQHFPSDDLNAAAKEIVRCLKPGGMVCLIEQVSRQGSDYYLHRLPENYRTAFGGCQCLQMRPIRNCRSIFLAAAYRGLVPGFLLPLMARLEMFFLKRRPIPENGYQDYIFIFKKPAANYDADK